MQGPSEKGASDECMEAVWYDSEKMIHRPRVVREEHKVLAATKRRINDKEDW